MIKLYITLRNKKTELGNILQIANAQFFNSNLKIKDDITDNDSIGDLNARLYLEITSEKKLDIVQENISTEFLMAVGKIGLQITLALQEKVFTNGDIIHPYFYVIEENEEIDFNRMDKFFDNDKI